MIIGLGRKYFLSIMYLEFIKSCPGVSTPPHDSPASDLTQVLGGWNRMRWEDVIRTALSILSKDKSAMLSKPAVLLLSPEWT